MCSFEKLAQHFFLLKHVAFLGVLSRRRNVSDNGQGLANLTLTDTWFGRKELACWSLARCLVIEAIMLRINH